MVTSRATTVADYLASLPADRREPIGAVRDVILRNLPTGYEEGMQYGLMIGYYVPLSRYPDTYNGQPLGIAGIASRKGYMTLHLMSVYGDPAIRAWFEDAFRRSGKKLDMGKSCVRFKKLDDLPLDLVGQAIARVSVDDYIGFYEAEREKRAGKKAARKKPTAKRATMKKPARRAAAGNMRGGRKK